MPQHHRNHPHCHYVFRDQITPLSPRASCLRSRAGASPAPLILLRIAGVSGLLTQAKSLFNHCSQPIAALPVPNCVSSECCPFKFFRTFLHAVLSPAPLPMERVLSRSQESCCCESWCCDTSRHKSRPARPRTIGYRRHPHKFSRNLA